MKRFLSFIIGTVLITVLSFHNQVMAFGDNISTSMGNHMSMSSEFENCYGDKIDDCTSICCITNDFSYSSFSNIQVQENKIKFNKLKYSLLDVSFNKSLIYEWNLIGNISPPIIFSEYKNHEYIYLIGIIKSNT